jgi:hypothetical protein
VKIFLKKTKPEPKSSKGRRQRRFVPSAVAGKLQNGGKLAHVLDSIGKKKRKKKEKEDVSILLESLTHRERPEPLMEQGFFGIVQLPHAKS